MNKTVTQELNRKKRADISIMVAVFCVAFLAFCAFGIDMAYITLNRIKLQRATETTALASIARYSETLDDESEDFFKLYKTKFDTMQDAQIEAIQYKNEGNGIYKVKISTKLMSPTYFLRFAGVGGVKIEANAYAQTSPQIEQNKESGEIISLNNIMTDKKGDEFKVSVKGNTYGYFIFAGAKDKNNDYVWSDVGCKADVAVVNKNVSGKNYNLICSKEATFDLSRECPDTTNTNVVSYLRIFQANPSECGAQQDILKEVEEKIKEEINNKQGEIDTQWKNEFPKDNEETGESIPWEELVMPQIPDFPITLDWVKSLIPEQDKKPYEITVLNNVKLITKNDF